MSAWPWFIASYLLGSLPTSWIVVRLVKGQDLRKLGSGNLGATNLYRQLGWRWAVPAAVIDIGKGVVPVLVFGPRAGGGDIMALLLGITAVLGHVFSVFVNFRGGKGVATGAGVLIGLAPWAALVAIVVWGVVVKLTGYVSLGSVLGALVLVPALWLIYPDRRALVWPFTLLVLMIVILHRANIQRLLNGTEHRFGRTA